MSKIKCAATTKSGKPCSRNAQEDSAFCAQHAAIKVEVAAPPTVESKVANKQAEVDAVKEALGELNQRVEEIKSKSPKFSPSDFSPEKLLGWIKENLTNFKLPVVEELKEKLSQATAEDFKNPETWKEIWVIVSHHIQQEAGQAMSKAEELVQPAVSKAKEQLESLPSLGEARQQIEENKAVKDAKAFVEGIPGVKEGQELLNKVPGAATLNSLGQAIEKTAPKDFLDSKTWEGFWTVVNHSLKKEMDGLRGMADEEEEIIVVTKD
ncbi:MAG: hypothetical protein AB8G95_01340 [Anaerolineae bacterium]